MYYFPFTNFDKNLFDFTTYSAKNLKPNKMKISHQLLNTLISFSAILLIVLNYSCKQHTLGVGAKAPAKAEVIFNGSNKMLHQK